MVKKIVLVLILLFLSTIVFAQYFLVGECMVYDDESNQIIYPTRIDLDKDYQYQYFKPSVANELNKTRPYFTPETNVYLWSGVNWDVLRCKN